MSPVTSFNGGIVRTHLANSVSFGSNATDVTVLVTVFRGPLTKSKEGINASYHTRIILLNETFANRKLLFRGELREAVNVGWEICEGKRSVQRITASVTPRTQKPIGSHLPFVRPTKPVCGVCGVVLHGLCAMDVRV